MNKEGGLLNPKLFNERILATAERVGFERTSTCCPNVVAKMCGQDVWKGDLGGLVRAFIKEHFPEVYHEQPPATD